MEEINEKLNEEILNELGDLQMMALGTDEHVTAVKSLSELYKLSLEQIRSESEAADKKKAAKDRRMGLLANAGVSLLGLGATLLHENRLANKCLRFEETGSFQSVISKNVFGKILRKR